MHFQKPPLGVPLDWEHPFNKDLALHFAMNEGHGDVVRDLSMNDNHGTLNNFAFPPTVASGWNPGQTGVGLNFEAAGSNYINCGHNLSLTPTQSISIGMLINPSVVNTRFYGVYKSLDYFLMLPENNGTIIFRFWDHLGNIKTSHITTTPITAEDHCVHAIYDGVDAKIYVDGIEKYSSNADAGTILHTSANDLLISGNGAADFFDGAIDQVRIQNRVPTAKEVKDYTINPWQVYLDEEDM